MCQGRVPDSRRLLLIGTPCTRSRSRRGLSPPPSRFPGMPACLGTNNPAQWHSTGCRMWPCGDRQGWDTNDQGHAQAGDTHDQGVEPFGDVRGQGTSMTRVMCNEGTQPSWGHSGSGGATLGGTQLGVTSLQGTHRARGVCPLETPNWGIHPSKGHIPLGGGMCFQGVPKGMRANLGFGDTVLGVMSLRGANTSGAQHYRGHPSQGDTGSLLLPRVPCT